MKLNLIRLRDNILSIQYHLNEDEKYILNELLKNQLIEINTLNDSLKEACFQLQKINLIELNQSKYQLTDVGKQIIDYLLKFEQ